VACVRKSNPSAPQPLLQVHDSAACLWPLLKSLTVLPDENLTLLPGFRCYKV
jgi:hypothetical protein